MKRIYPLLIVLLMAAPLVGGCSGQSNHASQQPFGLAALEQMPAEVRQAPVTVQQAYQFAASNPDILTELPCYCGCGAMGHQSNYHCYIQAGSQADDLVYDNHALGCSICVDITQDAMRLLADGQNIEQIFQYVDATYSRFGPATPLQ
ncbi:MAG: PCYCGC motif-containing (lipo)protein [Candidatus Promineifilaceae bacterium]|nr:PCYCGC motif-containing (lipo)protein [Candidatus Promineifilaceae bacterium]